MSITNGCGLHMATKFNFSWKGLEEYIDKLDSMNADGITKRGVFDGGEVMYNEIKSATMALKVGKGGNVNEVQYQGLISSLGYTKMKLSNGRWSTRIGFNDYNADGDPNPLVANYVNSGTSRQAPTHFVDNAVKRAKAKCEQAIRERIETDINNLMKE